MMATVSPTLSMKTMVRASRDFLMGKYTCIEFPLWYSISYYMYITTSSLYSTVTWSVHSKRSSPRTDSKQFAEHLSRAMEDMRKLYNA